MELTCHIHPCRSAKERALAIRIADEVRTDLGEADFLDELTFTLSELGLEEARLQRRGNETDIRLEGNFLITWSLVNVGVTVSTTGATPTGTLTRTEAARAYRYNEKTLRTYQQQGWLPRVLSHEAMRAFASAVRNGSQHGVREDRMARGLRMRSLGKCIIVRKRARRTLLERWRAHFLMKPRRRSCLAQRPVSAAPAAHHNAPCDPRQRSSRGSARPLTVQRLRRTVCRPPLEMLQRMLCGTGPPMLHPAHAP